MPRQTRNSARQNSLVHILYSFAIFVGLVSACDRIGLHASDELREADTLRLTGRYAEAAEKYGALADMEPVAAAAGLARCQRAEGEYDQAVQTLLAAMEKQPQAAELSADLAVLEFERGKYDAAQKYVDQSLKLNPSEPAARWIAAELHRVAGRMDEANKAYEWFIDFYNREQARIADPEDLHWIGLAAGQFARWNRNSRQFSFLVNSLYPDALKLDKNYWPANVEAALLFLEKYNPADATGELNAALAINPNAAEVHAVRAMVALQKVDLDAARISLDRALEINPRLVMAHQLKADMHLAMLGTGDAAKALEEARKLNPVDERTLGQLAAAYGAIDGLKDDPAGSRMAELIDEAVGRNKHCGEFFAALAASLDLLRKYPQAAKHYEEAQRRMPQLIGVPGQLGLMYMRLGDEARAKKLLDEAFKIDPFNVRVKNTLEVLDVLQGYAVIETEHFVIKFDRGQDELLARYAARYLEEDVYPDIVAKLGYEPPDKSLFEIFSRAKRTSGHGWFSARMVGLPFIHTVGACAGKMVALASPNDMPQKFNWARVLKHEFVHVVNLQQTDFNIPHWYTEALAVRNEGYPPPPSWNEVLARRAAAGKLFGLDTINMGFVRPASGDDWTLAYCQAKLYADYMVATYGDDAPAKMLSAYAANLDTRRALLHCFGVEQAAFEKGYRQYIDALVAGLKFGETSQPPNLAELERAVKDDPQNADLLAQLAYAHMQRGAVPQARESALAAQKIEPKQQLAAYVMARVYLSIGDTDQAVKLLEDALDEQAPQENALALLAALKSKAKDHAEAERLYALGEKHFPHADKWLKALARVYLEAGDTPKLTDALARLAEMDSDDLTLRKKLAQLAIDRKDFSAATRWATESLYIDVMDAEVHALLARVLAERQVRDRAIEEYETAIRLDSKQLAWRLGLAEVCVEAKQPDDARQALKELLELDPEYPGARELLDKL